jgi:hypothetical protein
LQALQAFWPGRCNAAWGRFRRARMAATRAGSDARVAVKGSIDQLMRAFGREGNGADGLSSPAVRPASEARTRVRWI